MTKYEAELEIPMNIHDLDAFVEALRAYGHPKIVVRFETSESHRTKKAIAADVANELSTFWGHAGTYGTEWWLGRLEAIRGNGARDEI
jgi:hypothetical protein